MKIKPNNHPRNFLGYEPVMKSQSSPTIRPSQQHALLTSPPLPRGRPFLFAIYYQRRIGDYAFTIGRSEIDCPVCGPWRPVAACGSPAQSRLGLGVSPPWSDRRPLVMQPRRAMVGGGMIARPHLEMLERCWRDGGGGVRWRERRGVR